MPPSFSYLQHLVQMHIGFPASTLSLGFPIGEPLWTSAARSGLDTWDIALAKGARIHAE